MSLKFLPAFIFLILGIFLQLFLGGVSGVWINFVLAALVVAAFSVNFLELLVLILSAIFVLNWQPAFSLEMALYALLPAFILWLRKFFPLKPWIGIPIAIFLCLLTFYLIIGARFIIAVPAVFLWDLVGGLAFGATFFKACETIVKSI